MEKLIKFPIYLLTYSPLSFTKFPQEEGRGEEPLLMVNPLKSWKQRIYHKEINIRFG